MQTFVPYADYVLSAQCLDRQRLGKQRVENLQIMKAAAGLSKAWSNHPATRMWADNLDSFWVYHTVICDEWISRGYKDTCREKGISFLRELGLTPNYDYPAWWGSEIHSTHRSNLLKKDYDFYSQYEWLEPDNLEYFWPV